MAVCTEKCRGCGYQKKFAGGPEGGMIYCDYICMEDKPRPCPAGDECTVFREKEAPWTPTPITIEPRKRGPKPKDITEEERAAHEEDLRLRRRERQREYYSRNREKHREKGREKSRAYYERHKEEVLARQTLWRRNNRETVNAYARGYRARQKEKKEAEANG